MSMGEYDEALDYFRESYRLIIEMEKKDRGRSTSTVGLTRINICLMNMADVHYRKGNYEEAFRMLGCIDGIDDERTKAYYYTRVIILKCLIFIKMGVTDEMTSYVDMVIRNAEGYKEGLTYLEDYLSLAGALLDAGYFDKTKKLLKACERIVKKVDLDDKWCLYLKTRIDYMKKAEPDQDRTPLYEKYFECRDKVDRGITEQQLNSLKNKRRLEEEIKKRNKAEQNNRKLKALSEHDQLTGVFNRYAMNELGQAWFDEAKEKGSRLSFMIIDIDYFKEYNDTYGHLGGDEVLRTIGKVLIDSTLGTDLVIRYGGDEFFIISKGRSDKEVITLGSVINREINEKKIVHAASPISGYVTLSFGAVSGKIMEDQNLIDAIHFADNALYRIKNETRNALGLYKQVGDDELEFEIVKFE
ncbi:MAG: diguanylate cyclase [Lachnospiraceae bacterium]|nr:diguanylate cyclase [Lachnospiraceae bacterium]